MWFLIPIAAIGGYWYYTKEETEKAILREKAAAADEKAKAANRQVTASEVDIAKLQLRTGGGTFVRTDPDEELVKVTSVKGLLYRY